MTLSQIRRLIDSLMLKYADEVEVYRLQPVAQQFCDDMANAVTGKKRGRRRSLDEWAEIFFRRGPRARPQPPARHGPSQQLPGALPRPPRPAPGQRNPARTAAPCRPPRPHPPPRRESRPLLTGRLQSNSKRNHTFILRLQTHHPELVEGPSM